jgi:short-subunit dehydrogenase
MGDAFQVRYGPWAVVAGASEGVGAALARAFAARGVHVVLLARRQAVLDEVAASIRVEAEVEVRAVAVDLTDHDAMERIVAATADVEVGLVAYCAGADPNYEPFLANPVETALGLVRRNCAVPVEMCHHFAGPMAARGRGGIVLVGSGAGLVGAPNMVAYGASKAFDMVLGEALWAELHDQGVDVLSLVLGVTDTPALRRLLARRGVLASAEDDSPIPGAVSAEEVAEQAIANLANGPTWFVGDLLRDGARQLGAMSRNDAVRGRVLGRRPRPHRAHRRRMADRPPALHDGPSPARRRRADSLKRRR